MKMELKFTIDDSFMENSDSSINPQHSIGTDRHRPRRNVWHIEASINLRQWGLARNPTGIFRHDH